MCDLMEVRKKSKDKLVILGDFYARVGRDLELWKEVQGRNGIGNYNDNRRLLLDFCSEHQLVITNTLGNMQTPTLQTLAPPGLRPDSAA